jgi:hypothetical protein
MALCSSAAYGLLSWIAFRRSARLTGATFVVAVPCLLAVGGMGSGEQTLARQWMEEGINSAGQIARALGSFCLYRGYIRTTAEMDDA